MMNRRDQILREVMFLAPPITMYQADHVDRWLFEWCQTQPVFSSEIEHELSSLFQRLRRYELGQINLIQSFFMLAHVGEFAYRYTNDRVLSFLQQLSICTGETLCSPLAEEISNDSKFCQTIDAEHAKYRNEIETYRMKTHLRYALRKLGQDDQRWNEHIESIELHMAEPVNMQFDDKRFYASTEVLAKQLVETYSGGNHE